MFKFLASKCESNFESLEQMSMTGVCHSFPFGEVKLKIVKVNIFGSIQSTKSKQESESDFERKVKNIWKHTKH